MENIIFTRWRHANLPLLAIPGTPEDTRKDAEAFFDSTNVAADMCAQMSAAEWAALPDWAP